MTRKELYAKIVELNLKDEINKTFGKNFTTCSNQDLNAFIAKHLNEKSNKSKKIKNSTTIIEVSLDTPKCTDKLDRLIEVLSKNHIIISSEINYILGK